jgi:hypothetical protein
MDSADKPRNVGGEGGLEQLSTAPNSSCAINLKIPLNGFDDLNLLVMSPMLEDYLLNKTVPPQVRHPERSEGSQIDYI